MQDTLVDEGLRVVKESLNQQKDPVSGARNQDSSSYPRAPQQQAAQQDGLAANKHNSAPSGTVPPSTTAAQGRLVSPPTTYSEMFSYPENKVRKVMTVGSSLLLPSCLYFASLVVESRWWVGASPCPPTYRHYPGLLAFP